MPPKVLAIALVLCAVYIPTTVSSRELNTIEASAAETYLHRVEATGDVPRRYVTTMASDRASFGDINFAVLYTHENSQGLGGNAYDQRLVVFLIGGSARLQPIDIVVGGKLRRDLKLVEVSPTMVSFTGLGYSISDAACCPSIPLKVIYRLSDGHLVESGAPNNRMERSLER